MFSTFTVFSMVRLMASVSVVLGACVAGVSAHPDAEPLAEWTFVPAYVLPGNGAQTLGPRPRPPESPRDPIAYEPSPVSLYGYKANDRITRLMDGPMLPRGPFTVEMWVIDHVNQPVGALLAAKGFGPGDDVAWAVGYSDNKAVVRMAGGESGGGVFIEAPAHKTRDARRYWRHIVAVYDTMQVRLYLNGELVGTSDAPESIEYDAHAQLEIAGYLDHEPYMQIGNLVHSARIYSEALDGAHINERFAFLCEAVERGVLFPGRMHFTAGPYLNSATQTSMAVLWETDRAATGSISYGIGKDLTEKVELNDLKRIQEVVLDGLAPNTMYHYRVEAYDESGRSIDSGLLTFQTAVKDDEPFVFGIIGDTEARPHVNDRIAKMLWEQRPHFVVNCGDLTDGGKQDRKFQWTHEYFLGMGQLHSRIPCFPVAGNGEGDLYWYNRYHVLPEPEGYYAFRYGNAEFFMLDSNRSREQFKPGGEQYEWLKKKLSESTATWKFAAHHHPTVTSDEDDYGDTWKGEASPQGDTNVMPIMELYDRFGVDAVFFGHLHSYERSWPTLEGKVSEHEGVVYIQTGGGGGNPEDFRPAKTWFSQNQFRGHHYSTIAINGGTLEFRMFNTDGSLRDVMTIKKPRGGTAVITDAGE